MRRDLLIHLESWKSHPLRKPLIIRGARQVGKSWLVNEFGKQFETFITINFEKSPEVNQFFEGGIRIPELLEKLSLYTGEKIIPGKTLLFFDEIQECEKALVALRYFKEEHPELHVIAAGSLLDFTIEKLGVAVGRVQFLYLHPLSFGEFLMVQGREDLRKFIVEQSNDLVIHGLLIDYLKIYFWLGGMPAVVDGWLRFKDVKICSELQDEIIQSYKQDFQKYARKHQIDHVEKMFEAIPQQLGRKFKYTDVDSDTRSAPLKDALMLLLKAGIAHIVYHSSGQAQPLGATKDLKKFKVFYFDIGLAQRILGLDLKEWVIQPLEVRHIGAIAEQFVAQEYIAYTSVKSPPELYYWHREEKRSNAEVDFLFLKNGMVVPVEVKAGSRGGLKSLAIFLETHLNSTLGLKISESQYDTQSKIQNIPFYGVEAWINA
ncbi:MAG: ATP-binding protein [Gammaproteobacteria bacterium]|nr:ATP-binding protein [Gammaproteobacteria bacterium]